ncbi:enoyl-CoA hydratase-related protein [Streptomyces sp. NPDC005438]|uniref:enoyl-CoA hydratase/isomerase family protein n=1 Tax=Streptomyces sp. NPDC005438 TaxID=3156880 RepID=UPI0033AD6DE4
MSDTVLYELTEGLATVTLNRPDAMNALDTELKEALRDTLQQVARDPAVRAVLLTGNGRGFCVGQDLKEHVRRLNETEGGEALRTVHEHYNPIALAIATMPKPVVAAVNGAAAGAGAGFAFAADYRVVSEKASFTTAFAAIGLTADSGMSWTLPRLVGTSRATELLMFPRSVHADEARELGIANRVVAPEALAEEARTVARTLAEGPTAAYAAIKESLAYAADHTLAETLEKEAELQIRSGGTQDHRIAVDAFVAKERPRYVGH